MSTTKKLSFESALFFCIPALFFVTPLSSSLKSILLVVSIAIILISPQYRQELKYLLLHKYCLTTLLLFAIALIGYLWSPASLAEKNLILEKWSKLLYLPFLIVGLTNPKVRHTALNAFLSAMLITCLLSVYIHFTNHLHFGKITADGVFRNHIMTGIMMSFAAYLSGMFFLKAKNGVRIFYLLTSLLFSYQILFINESRTGYAIYLVLISLLIAQNLNFRQTCIGILSLALVFASSCYLSTTMWSRIKLSYQEWHSFTKDQNTPLGYRIQFHNYAKTLFYKSPIIGNGTASFTHSFKIDNPVPAWTADKSHSGKLLEPHSQYWLIAAEFGILGLIAFLLFYSELIIRFYNLKTLRPMAFALLSVLTIGNLTDSLLFYSGSGYFFIMFFALCLSENITALELKTVTNTKPLQELATD